MGEHEEPYSFDLNLDFLESTTANTKPALITPIYQHDQSQIHSLYDIESLATRIASVNDVTIQLNSIKDENSRLHKQMQEFSESAMSIRSMYEQEKTERLRLTKLYEELKENFQQTESQLTNKTLHFEQIQSRLELESEDKKPIPYNDLALRYQRLALQLEEEKLLPAKDKSTLQQIKDYVESKKLVPLAPPKTPSKRKAHSKSVKTQDFSMQFDSKVESESQETQCNLSFLEEEPKDTCTQGTQYSWYTTTRGTNTPAFNTSKTDTKSQGTQYISSTTTRGTSTSTFIKTQSIGTNFPEPAPPVSLDDIFNEMICDLAPLSPMQASPSQADLKEEQIELKSTGTCTELRNVRKPIDYVVANIKHSDSRPPSRNSNSSHLYDRVKNEIPLMGMPTMNPFGGLGIPMHNNVAELWNMLGHTIFALLPQSSGANAAQMNQMHIITERVRNLSGRSRASSELRRNCEAQTDNDFFEPEFPRDYPTDTRNVATSPIISLESQNNETNSIPSFPNLSSNPIQTEFQKIVLNKNHCDDAVVSSSKKLSQVDEILQLFPEYSDSFKKRKAIKKLLKAAGRAKKPKKKRNSSSTSSSLSSTTQFAFDVHTGPEKAESSVKKNLQPKFQLPTNWKTEIFGESDSDANSSLYNSSTNFKPNPDETPETKKITQPTNEPPTCCPNMKPNSSEMQPHFEEEFHGFDEEALSSNEFLDSQFLQPKEEIVRNIQNKASSLTKTEISKDETLPVKSLNPKRKRRTKKSMANETNKICKLDESYVPPQSEEVSIETTKKPRERNNLKVKKGKANPLPPISNSAAVKKPLRSLSLNKAKLIKKQPNQLHTTSQNQFPAFVKPDWMNRVGDSQDEEVSIQVSTNNDGPMVMRVENPPKSVFEDIKTCFYNQRIAPVFQDIKTCVDIPKREPHIGLQEYNNKQQLLNSDKTPIVEEKLNVPNPAPPTNIEVINYFEPQQQNILSAQWNSKSSDIKMIEQELMSPIEEDDNSKFDLENMPICFLDEDKNLLNTPEQAMDTETCFEENQKANMLPGFDDIRRGMKTNMVQIIASPQEADILPTIPIHVNRLPVIVQATPTFHQAPMKIETMQKPLETHQKSFLLLNPRELVNSCQKYSKSPGIQEENQLQETSNCLNDLRSSNLPSPVIKGQIPSMTSGNVMNSPTFDKPKLLSDQCTQSTPKDCTPSQTEIVHLKPSNIISLKKERTDSQSSSGSENELSIDCPTSPQPLNDSVLDLSTILKTPDQNESVTQIQFKTPESSPSNTRLNTKVITNSTEKLVDDFISNENPGSKFQLFLDRILDDVAPPTSPVSAIAPSEKPNQSETESSCDESPTQHRKYKRKAPATAAIAVKRSERVQAKKIEAQKSVNYSLYSGMSIANVELGKYTHKKTEENLLQNEEKIIEPKKDEKINIAVGFFREAMDDENELIIDEGDEPEDDNGPISEPIRRCSVEEHKVGCVHENYMNSYKSTIIQQQGGEANYKPLGFNPADTNVSLHEESPTSPPPSELILNCDEEYKTRLAFNSTGKNVDTLFHEESPASPSPSEQTFDEDKEDNTNLAVLTSFHEESPVSPPPSECIPSQTHSIRECFDNSNKEKARTNSNHHKTILSHLIANYNQQHRDLITKSHKLDVNLLKQLQNNTQEYLRGICLVMDTIRFIDSVLKLTTDEKIIAKAIVNVLKNEPSPTNESTQTISGTYLSETHRKLLTVIAPLCHHYPNFHRSLQLTLEQSMFTFTKEIIPVEVLINLTLFYLAIINNPNAVTAVGATNPARLFICKCLYFFNQKAIPMIYHTLCVYPTILPQKGDTTYDRSDILISTIQSILMSTYYDPEKSDLMTKQILIKLKLFYKYESFKPPRDDVIENMMAKIRAGRLKNVSYALSVLCKRMEQSQTEKYILNERLLPLANEFYNSLQQKTTQTNENDEKIACVLECISFVIRPFDLCTDITPYVNLFERFLNAATDNKVIQEAAVAAILRTARFGFVQCFNAIYNFKPTYELSETLKLMLRSLIYKKSKAFLLTLEQQAKELVAA